MYPNLLLSIFIALVAFLIIGAILNAPRLVKAALVLIVAEAAVAMILWLLMGRSPVPPWFARWSVRIVHNVQRAVHR